MQLAQKRASGARIPELDGIRGVAVGLVLLYHLWPNVGLWRAGVPFTEIGWIGVDLFFVLSGFLITGILVDSAKKPDYFSRFYTRRAFRIFPLYYAFLIFMVGFLAFWHEGHELGKLRTQWGSPALFFVYVANYTSASTGLLPPFGPLGPPWSLQIEEQFYLVFPTVVRFFRKRLWPILISVMIAALAWRIGTFLYAPGNAMAQYVGTLSRLDGLAAGGLAALAMRRFDGSRLRRASAWAVPISGVVLVAFYSIVGTGAYTPATRLIGYSLNAIAFAWLILWAVQRSAETPAAVFRCAPLVWLGGISYGVYLLQLPVESIVKLLEKSPLGTPQRLPAESFATLAATLLIAWLSWRLFEKPLQDYGHQLTRVPNRVAHETMLQPLNTRLARERRDVEVH